MRRNDNDSVEEISSRIDDNTEAEEYCSDDESNYNFEDIGYSWMETLGSFEKEWFEQDQESISDLEIANDISSLKYILWRTRASWIFPVSEQ